MTTATTFRCRTCDEEHDIRTAAWGPDAPSPWWSVSDVVRARSELTPDQCVIERDDGVSFYIRGCLDLPIRGHSGAFRWLVWCSLSERSHEEVCAHWEDFERAKLGPYFGWLANELPFYRPSTLSLATSVVPQPPGLRPVIHVRGDHPLAVEQRDGVDPDELRRRLTILLHPAPIDR